MAWQLSAYLALSHLIPLVAPMALRRRLKRGKEDPARWREKLGEASLPRPDGPLVWLHAVGLGEVLALRGLVLAMAAQRPDLQFLITSSARSSAQVVAGQLPPNSRHQFLPLDAPRYLARFLAHWRPDLSIWAEQDLWPGAVVAADRAGIPLAMVNARMNDAAFARRARARGLYGDLLRRFRLIAAQDQTTADNSLRLGASDAEVTGSLKAASPPLVARPEDLAQAERDFAERNPWLLASSHPEDEVVALEAARALPDRLLIIAPRDPGRAAEIATAARACGLTTARRSLAETPEGAQVYIADTFGEMGIWYRISPVTLIGGTFGATEGHNPWEPAAVGSAVLHGPHVANFVNDFRVLHQAEAALAVNPQDLVAALTADLGAMAGRALALSEGARDSLAPLAARLCGLIGRGDAR